MILGSLSVARRFLVVLLIGSIFQGGVSLVSLAHLRQLLMQDRINEVKHLLETGYSIATYYYDQSSRGLMTDAAAQAAAAAAIRNLHYDGKNYFFIWDLNGKSIAHGGKMALEGRTFLNSPDAEKNPVVSQMVAELVDVASKPPYEGLCNYRIPKFGQTIPLPKISYAKLFKPWGWSIGTGAYVDDIDAAFWTEALSALAVFLGLIALAAVASHIVARDMVRAMSRISARVTSVARGELDGEVPDIDRRDEIGVIARALLVLRDTSREAHELRLDHLTGLPTRKLLMDQLGQIKVRNTRRGVWGALMLIDLDEFKSLNDTHGHDAGDALLKEVAQRLTASVREGDTVARLGGDEFVVVLDDIGRTEEEALGVLDRVSQKLLTVLGQPYHLGSIVHTTTASMGGTTFRGGAYTAEGLLKQADLAMYRSKDAGGNVCRFFDTHMEVKAQERATAERDLRQSIAGSQFVLFYQPQIDARGQLTGAEALVRWQHPQRGLVAPDEFIPLAEETGLILPLGRWVLETACRQLSEWAEHPKGENLKLSVNISPRQFQHPGFVDQVLEVLRATGANPARLTLELTENVLISGVGDASEKMARLRAAGIGLALDDFGTGYSSLQLLKSLPLNVVKIDRTFVRNMLTNENDAAVITMILELAKTLSLEVVAEGIETLAQWNFLLRLGCQYGQGYYFSQTLPREGFEQFAFAGMQKPRLVSKFAG
jgi:diguanylate cyclase (GGDEF)-like protein